MIDRLFVYGTLAPGRSNAHVLAGLDGTWEPGTVRGVLFPEGWGAAQGYPGLVLDPSAEPVRGLVFTSAQLAHEWPRIDAFEGAGYRRVVAQVLLDGGGRVPAFLYELNR